MELMKEMSTSGGAGGYLTKAAFRKPKKQDIKSPTGFESSPNPNMYTKKMKFKIVNPKQRLNSKDLWKEVKVNKPGLVNAFTATRDPQEVKVAKLGKIGDSNWGEAYWTEYPKGQLDILLYDSGEDDYSTNHDQGIDELLPEFTIENPTELYKSALKKYNLKPNRYIYLGDNLNEIKVNNPLIIKAKLNSGDKNNILVYKRGVNYNEYKDEIDKSLEYQGYDDSWDRNSTTWSLISFPEGDKNVEYWWTDDEIDFSSSTNEVKVNNPTQPFKIGQKVKTEDGEEFIVSRYVDDRVYIYPEGHRRAEVWVKKQDLEPINESRYTQFKRSASKPKPQEILHRAIKEIGMKLDDVNRLIEFTSRIKGELQEGDQEIEYLKRTKNSIYKIHDKLKEVLSKITSIDEVRVNTPGIKTEKDLIQLYNSIPEDRKREEVEDIYFNKYPEAVYLDELIPNLSPIEITQFYNDLLKLSKSSPVDEVKINRPKRVWDFIHDDWKSWNNKVNIGDYVIDPNGEKKEILDMVGPDIIKTDTGTYNMIRLNNQNIIKNKNLGEIKINKPARNWDFTKPIHDFNPDNIKVGDIIVTKKGGFLVNKIDIGHNDFQTKFYTSNGGDYITKSSLIFMNKIRHNQ